MVDGNYPQPNRRTVLKAAGLTATSAGLQGVVVGSGERRKRVRRGFDMHGQTTSTMKVPKSWHNRLNSVRRRKSGFDDEYLRDRGVDRTAIVPSDEKHGGWNGFAFKIVIDSEKYEKEPPDKYRGVDVRVEEVEDDDGDSSSTETGEFSTQSDGCYYNTYYWSTLFGGIPFWVEGSAERPSGTHTWEVEFQGNRFIQAAHHTFMGGCSTDSSIGEMTYQNERDRKQGPVWAHNSRLDAAIVDPNAYDFYEIENGIVDEEGTEAWPITEILDYSNLYYMMIFNSPSYMKSGSASGETEGFVEELGVSQNSTCDFYGEGVRGSVPVTGGDSGGPAFVLEDGTASLVKMITHPRGAKRWTGCVTLNGQSVGPAAYELDNRGYTPVTN